MNKRTQFSTALVVTVGLLTACGGGSDSAGTDTTSDVVATSPTDTTRPTDPPATDPLATDPPVTDPPATDPPDSGLPDWASGELVTVGSDTGPLEIPVELAPFCESSRSFYVAARGVDFVSEAQPKTLQQLFAALVAVSPSTIESAPSEELATQPTAARDHLAVIIPGFEEIGYDGDRISELSDPETFLDALGGFFTTRDLLEVFLVESCGAAEDVLDGQARDLVAIAADAAGEVAEPDEPVEAVAGSPISNARSTITVSVLADWTEIDDSPYRERDQLIASSDLAAFEALETPGVLVLRGEGGFRDGGFVGRVLDTELRLEGHGCELVDQGDYDDGTYAGQERRYDCGVDGLDVRLLGGANADESLYAMVLVVFPADQLGVRQLIVDTFDVA